VLRNRGVEMVGVRERWRFVRRDGKNEGVSRDMVEGVGDFGEDAWMEQLCKIL
jgi:hypothetical protein